MGNLKENKYYIWLSSLDKISLKDKIMLLKKYKTPEEIFYKAEKDLIVDDQEKRNINELIEKMDKMNIKVITYKDDEYPDKLKQIYDFPICLYCKGNLEILNTINKNKIAIIGCREYSNYGKKVTDFFAYNLAKRNFTIVSGGARGIDSFAHLGSINAKKGTISVLGNGLDYIYPPENRKLEEKIIQNNGLIISEYIVGTRPSKYTFPARNRIISAISDGVLVVEAKQRSGTLITVDFALEQGKNIYVIPGNIDVLNSVGTNELIKQGAKVVTKIEDILEDFKSKI